MKTVTCQKCGTTKSIPDHSESWFCSCSARVSECSRSDKGKNTISRSRCVFLGDPIEEIPCNCPIKPKIYECEHFDQCITHKNFSEKAKNLVVCEDCEKYQPFY